MQNEHKTQLQIELEKYTADINPMHLVIGTDREYEHEIDMFLERITGPVTEDNLLKIIRQVFREMFNLKEDDKFIDSYKKIVQEYFRLKKKY